MSVLLALLLALQGRPLYYWGALAPVISVARSGESAAARVREVHAALDEGDLVLRFSFDRAVADALRLADGTPVSGRLSAVLYLDTDDDRASGFDAGRRDPRSGAERRVRLTTLYLGEDPPERPRAGVVVRATLASVARDGRRRTLWRADDQDGDRLSWRGEWVELRMPADRLGLERSARLVLDDGAEAYEGRFEASGAREDGR